ncbi:MAG TPA: cysteine hydrolase [Desulfobacteraceae bacterium]|nr:MAG: cysteine hydrolase [Deltaproteobacteria bacterium]HDZ24631.1 cysteine hydrolase [Desulfobacteraceae bacterium]
MENNKQEKPALLVIDMVKDNFRHDKPLPITPFAKAMIPRINQLSGAFREKGCPVVFATDAFSKDDFIFKGSMKPHSLAGTEGAEVVDELDRDERDLWLPKPRFSAFFRTDLADWLHQRGVTLCAVSGIATNFCVLTTVMDALCHDFKAVLIEDCTAAMSKVVHEQILACYRHNPLYPLFRILPAKALMEGLFQDTGCSSD